MRSGFHDMARFLPLLCLSLFLQASDAEDPRWCNQFRGPTRDGVYPANGLLASWPADGPELLWERSGLGSGYSSPVVTPEGIFVTGDVNGELMVTALAPDGTLRWRATNGEAWKGPYPGARSTPTYHRGRMYHINAHGRLACIDAGTGAELWHLPLLERFGSPNIQWGISECPLVVGDRLYATPGGPETLMVALDAATGNLLWQSPPLRFLRTEQFGGKPVEPPAPDTDKAGYASPVRFPLAGRELLATASARHFVLLDAGTGDLLWTEQMPVRHEVIGAIPVVRAPDVFFAAPDCGGFLFRVAAQGTAIRATRRWEIPHDNCHGAMVLAGKWLVGSGYRKNREWAQVEWESGQLVASLPGLPKGAAVWADGRVYALSERGTLLLLEPSAEGLAERGRMRLTDGKRADIWAHPVIHGGRLFLRVGDTLRCHDLRRGE